LKSKERKRLDLLLVEQGSALTRRQAQAIILSGKVKVNGLVQSKAGALVSPDSKIEIVSPPRYVGRGGIKLEHALSTFRISAENKVCLDVGSSTGGFTDCLLQHGAKFVYAVDVGRGQLAWKLRQDSRVKSLEKLNARYLSTKEVLEPVDLCVIDVSFISVEKILPAVKALIKNEGKLIVLLKPQFEAGPKHVKKGIVKDKMIHREVLENFVHWTDGNHYFPKAADPSPITGADGNIEFLIHLELYGPAKRLDIPAIVERGHQRVEV